MAESSILCFGSCILSNPPSLISGELSNPVSGMFLSKDSKNLATIHFFADEWDCRALSQSPHIPSAALRF